MPACPRRLTMPDWLSSRAWQRLDTTWVFVVLGLLQLVVAFLLAVFYLSIRSLTSSLQHVETVPSYAAIVLVLCSGILVTLLSKMRDPMLLVAACLLNVVCTVLSCCSAALMGAGSVRTMRSYLFCFYDATPRQCHCYTQGVATNQEHNDEFEYVYESSPSCEAITFNLRNFINVLCGLHGVAVILCAVAAGWAVFAMRKTSCNTHTQEQLDTNGWTCWHGDSENVTRANVTNAPVRVSLRPEGITPRRSAELSFGRRIALPGMRAQHLSQHFSVPGLSLADAADDDDPRLVRVQRCDTSSMPPASTSLPSMARDDPASRRQLTGDVRADAHENSQRSEDSDASLRPVPVDVDQRSAGYRGRYLQQDVTTTAAAAASLALRVWDLQTRPPPRHGPRSRVALGGHSEQTTVSTDFTGRRSRSLRRWLMGGSDDRRRLQHARIVAGQAAFFGGQMALMADAFPTFPREPPPPYCLAPTSIPSADTYALPSNTT